MKDYSFLKGLTKAIGGAVVFGLSLAGVFLASAHPDLANQGVVDFVTTTLSSKLTAIFGTMTIGGLIALISNFIKVTYLSN